MLAERQNFLLSGSMARRSFNPPAPEDQGREMPVFRGSAAPVEEPGNGKLGR